MMRVKLALLAVGEFGSDIEMIETGLIEDQVDTEVPLHPHQHLRIPFDTGRGFTLTATWPDVIALPVLLSTKLTIR